MSAVTLNAYTVYRTLAYHLQAVKQIYLNVYSIWSGIYYSGICFHFHWFSISSPVSSFSGVYLCSLQVQEKENEGLSKQQHALHRTYMCMASCSLLYAYPTETDQAQFACAFMCATGPKSWCVYRASLFLSTHAHTTGSFPRCNSPAIKGSFICLI